MSKVIIIAEAGVNHNGDLAMAKQLIAEAANAGADYCKFQTFIPELNISETAPRAAYQINNTGVDESQLDMVRRLALSQEDHFELNDFCKTCNIGFMSTAFDIPSVDLLAKMDMPIWKVPSGEITNDLLLKKIASVNKPVLLSTGMANLSEIEHAIEVLVEHGNLSRNDITILHCNTEYPTPWTDVNLHAMQTIAQAFKMPVGYSDHTLGIEVPIAAVALGAVVIEKHFTLDKSLPGPDHKASLEPGELSAMVSAIRNIELALGDGIKRPSPSERKNISIARKSLHTKTMLERDHVLTEDDLIPKRPGDGISPIHIGRLLGKKLRHELPKDYKISESDIA